MFRNIEFKILKNILIETTEKYDRILDNYSSLNLELKFIKQQDTITNVLSKKGFLEKLEELIKKANDKTVFLIVIDLDNFKYINDVYGHGFGDIFLNHIASIISEIADSYNGLVGRIGGDAFGVAIFDKNLKDISLLAKDILAKISDFYIKIGKTIIKTTASAGISIYPYNSKDVDSLVAQAEQAMYFSKTKGRNTFTFYNKEIGENFIFVEKYKTMLNEVIKSKSVVPFIQPIYNLSKKRIIGGEVLIRVQYGGEIIPAGSFISVAERFGLIDTLEDILFEKIQEENFINVVKGKTIFINKTIKSAIKAERVKKSIDGLIFMKKQHHITPVIEITESSFVEFFNILIDFISFSRKKGIRLALDDFGAGYASFSYLLNFDVDILKIDGSLIKTILRSDKSKSIVKAISSIAKDFGIKTIAEYIENKDILEEVSRLGIDCVQGYYISKPVHFLKFKQILKK